MGSCLNQGGRPAAMIAHPVRIAAVDETAGIDRQ
jgi:hypothetical protein